MIRIAPDIHIPEAELMFSYARASGPGGQHVNKVESAVVLRFDMRGSQRLTAAVKRRLAVLAGSRLTAEGILVLHAQGERSRERNRVDAIARLTDLITRALPAPKTRRKTKPTRGSQERRIAAKKRRSAVKSGRGRSGSTDH